MDPLVKLRDFLRRIRCLMACCGSTLIIENSQVDGAEEDKNEKSELL